MSGLGLNLGFIFILLLVTEFSFADPKALTSQKKTSVVSQWIQACKLSFARLSRKKPGPELAEVPVPDRAAESVLVIDAPEPDKNVISKVPVSFSPSIPISGKQADFLRSERIKAQLKWGDELEYMPNPVQPKPDEIIMMNPIYNNVYEVDRHNRNTVEQLNKLAPVARPGRDPVASKEKIDSIFRAVADNPAASVCQLPKYDPQGIRGLCYGRAFAGYIEALRQGISKSSIKKIWALGNPGGPNGEVWSYHVGLAVKGDDGHWYVMDTLFEKAPTVEEWFLAIAKKEGTGETKINVTSPVRSHRGIQTKNSKKEFKSAVVTEEGTDTTFFADLIRSFREDAAALAREKRGNR